MYIGKRVKELRQAQRMKLVDLAEKSGVQIATLSRIENMRMIGSLESHMQIAKALGVDVTQLYTDLIKEESKVDVKTQAAEGDVFVHSDKSSFVILTSKVLSKKMMPILLKIEPDGQTNKEQNLPGSEKFVFVLEGKVEAHISQDTYPLAKHNTLYFDASLEHWFVNVGKVTAKVLCVGTPVAL